MPVFRCFHALKSITTGEGGMILTNNKDIFNDLLLLRNNGIVNDPDIMTENHGPWYYEQHTLGFNYWLSEIQSALGLAQFRHLHNFISKRNKLSEIYSKHFKDTPIKPIKVLNDRFSACHLYIVRIGFKDLNVSRKEIYDTLKSEGINSQVHYLPVPLHPYYKNLGFRIENYPESLKYYQEALSLPLYPDLAEKDVIKIANVLKYTIGVPK